MRKNKLHMADVQMIVFFAMYLTRRSSDNMEIKAE